MSTWTVINIPNGPTRFYAQTSRHQAFPSIKEAEDFVERHGGKPIWVKDQTLAFQNYGRLEKVPVA